LGTAPIPAALQVSEDKIIVAISSDARSPACDFARHEIFPAAWRLMVGKEHHCKQTLRTIVDKPVPIALRRLWRNHTGSSAAAGGFSVCGEADAAPKISALEHDKISAARDVRARFPTNRDGWLVE
jgi:hypothetical protein